MVQHVISCVFIACGLCGLWGLDTLRPFLSFSWVCRGDTAWFTDPLVKKILSHMHFFKCGLQIYFAFSLPFFEGPYQTLFVSNCLGLPGCVCTVLIVMRYIQELILSFYFRISQCIPFTSLTALRSRSVWHVSASQTAVQETYGLG